MYTSISAISLRRSGTVCKTIFLLWQNAAGQDFTGSSAWGVTLRFIKTCFGDAKGDMTNKTSIAEFNSYLAQVKYMVLLGMKTYFLAAFNPKIIILP
jgi:hypothetical protein